MVLSQFRYYVNRLFRQLFNIIKTSQFKEVKITEVMLTKTPTISKTSRIIIYQFPEVSKFGLKCFYEPDTEYKNKINLFIERHKDIQARGGWSIPIKLKDKPLS